MVSTATSLRQRRSRRVATAVIDALLETTGDVVDVGPDRTRFGGRRALAHCHAPAGKVRIG